MQKLYSLSPFFAIYIPMKKTKTFLKHLLPVTGIILLTAGFVAIPFVVDASIHNQHSLKVNEQKLSFIQNIPSQIRLYSNQNLKLEVKTNARANQTVQYHWYYLTPSHSYDQQWTELSDITTNVLLIPNSQVQQYNSCEFKCVISDQHNHMITSKIACVNVINVHFAIEVPSEVYINHNGYCQISAQVILNHDLDSDQIEYNWYEINNLNQSHLVQSSFSNQLSIRPQPKTKGFICLVKDLTTHYAQPSSFILIHPDAR